MNNVDNFLENDLFNSSIFDPTDQSSWHFGDSSREEVVKYLMKEHEDGIFCVRESSTKPGSLVLSVRESGNGKDQPISHYLIDVKRNTDGSPVSYIIGDQSFLSMAQLLKFYREHYLESTYLLRPARRQYVKVLAKFDYNAQEPDDLSFKRNETLFAIKRDSHHQWWMARNGLGQSGLIPANYVEEFVDSGNVSNRSSSNSNGTNENDSSMLSELTVPSFQKTLPAFARVKMARIPNAYDKTALRLEPNDRVKVLKMDPSGTWEGELNGKVGNFPFTYIEWEEESVTN